MSEATDRVAAASWLLTSALVAAVGVRLFTVVTSEALGEAQQSFQREAPGPVASARAKQEEAKRRRDRILDLANEDEGGQPTKAGEGAKLQEPKTLRPQLYVNVGPERSQVYVNGVRVGLTPYIGDVTCREGDTVRVDVDPPLGVPLSFTGHCKGRLLSVDESSIPD